MVTKTLPWNSAELLRDKDDIAAYLEAALEEAFETNDVSAFTRALEVVAKSHGMKKIADEAGVDLGGISGSGPGGRIIRRDVGEAMNGGGRAPTPTQAAPQKPQGASQRPAPLPAPAGS